jgi:hypothetical protein
VRDSSSPAAPRNDNFNEFSHRLLRPELNYFAPNGAKLFIVASEFKNGFL